VDACIILFDIPDVRQLDRVVAMLNARDGVLALQVGGRTFIRTYNNNRGAISGSLVVASTIFPVSVPVCAIAEVRLERTS